MPLDEVVVALVASIGPQRLKWTSGGSINRTRTMDWQMGFAMSCASRVSNLTSIARGGEARRSFCQGRQVFELGYVLGATGVDLHRAVSQGSFCVLLESLLVALR